MNFLACGPGRPVVSRMKGTRLMCGYLSNSFVLAAETRDGLQEKGATIDTSKYVTEPLRLKTRSIRACAVCPLTTRESRYLLFNEYLHPQGISQQLHACDQQILRTDSRSSDAVAGPLVLLQMTPSTLLFEQEEAAGCGASISWLLRLGSSDPQPRTLHCSAA